MKHPRANTTPTFIWTVTACALAITGNSLLAYDIDLPSPVGATPISLQLSHAGPDGGIITPGPPVGTPFLPPSVFSTPLPRGSGSRALGFSGAFTAIADDATAASWNPAGLVQLERTEASLVIRGAAEHNTHRSPDSMFLGGSDDFQSANINYLSVVVPFYSKLLKKNVVSSFNYQEVYDFNQDFHATVTRDAVDPLGTQSQSGSFSKTSVTPFSEIVTTGAFIADWVGTVTVSENTTFRTDFNELLQANLVSEIDFKQEGGLSAITPAFAVELTPRVSIGGAVNIHVIDPSQGSAIKSQTRARYSGTTIRSQNTANTRTSSGDYTLLSSVIYRGSYPPRPSNFNYNTSGSFAPVTERQNQATSQPLYTEGVFTEDNRYSDWSGINGNLGLLWTLSQALTVGASVDLPWVAETDQTRTTRNQATTYNSARTQVLSTVDDVDTVSKSVEFEFPLSMAMGFVWRWSQNLYTSVDVGFAQWSEFSYKADGETRINPVSGQPHAIDPLDDTWSARTGFEYLVITEAREIPIRAGAAWEERPAIDGKDDYYSLSIGSGIALGDDAQRYFLDIAYAFTYANDIRGFVPLQSDLKTDVTEHQTYITLLKHF